jgi:hypothetical protein
LLGGIVVAFSSRGMNGALGDRRLDLNGATLATQLTAVDTALATGDVAAALRAWHELYSTTLGTRRWEGFAEAGDAFLRIARALGSPAQGMARARDLYMSALFRASGAGSLDGVLRLASAFVDLGDDEIVTHALRIARRLAGSGTEPDLHDLLAALETHVESAEPLVVSRRAATPLH